jgi:hypothetical protein
LEVLLYLLTEQIRFIPNVFLLCSYSFLVSYHESDIVYNTDGKEKTEDKKEDVKGTCIHILLSEILAVVVTLAAVNGITRSPIAIVDVRCSLYPKILPSLV